MQDSIVKPPKPYPAFPMYAHATKRWAAKIKGVTRYFGRWDDWEEALERYNYEVHFYQVGRTPPPKDVQALTVAAMVNLYLEDRETKVKSGEFSVRTWEDSKKAGELLVKSLGRNTTIESLEPKDFARIRAELTKRVGLSTVAITIQRCRVFFNWAIKNELIEKRVRFGTSFEKPGLHAIAKEKAAKPERIFTVDELATIYKAANTQMKCFMLLGLNGGLGPSDLGQLEAKHIQAGWVRFPRPKTSVNREFPLWPETQKAIEEVRQTKSNSELIFLTRSGLSWHKNARSSPLSREFSKVLDECNLHSLGRGFYALRHTFRTVADGCRDQVAINHIMGHSDSSMAANYRHGIEPERLQAVVDHVRKWLSPMLNGVAK